MKKNFVFLSLCCVLSLSVFSNKTLEAVNFDDFFKDIFGGKQTQQPAPRQQQPAPAQAWAAPGTKAPVPTTQAAAETTESAARIRAKLTECKNSLGRLNNSTQDITLHRAQARQQLLALIQGKPQPAATAPRQAPQPTPRPALKKTSGPQDTKKTQLPVYKTQGAIGAIALADLIIDEPSGIYSNNLATKKYAAFQALLNSTLHKLSDLHDENEKLEAILKKKSPDKKSSRALLGVLTPQQKQAQKNLEDQLVRFYRDLPKFTEALEKVLTDSAVQKQINALPRGGPRDYYDRYGAGGAGRPGGSSWEGRRPWAPYGQGRDSRYGGSPGGSRYSYPSSGYPSGKGPDGKASKGDSGKGYGPRGKTKKDKKDKQDKKIETNIFELTKRETALLEKIFSGLPVDVSVIDEKIATLLREKQDDITDLLQTRKDIETVAKTAKGMADMKKPAYQTTARAYHQAVLKYLARWKHAQNYGYAEIEEDERGRYHAIVDTPDQQKTQPILISQATLKEAYDRTEKSLPKTPKDEAVTRAKRYQEKLTTFLHTKFASTQGGFQTKQRALQAEAEKAAIDMDNTKLKGAAANLLTILRLLRTAKNSGVLLNKTPARTAAGTPAQTQPPNATLFADAQRLWTGEFSDGLQIIYAQEMREAAEEVLEGATEGLTSAKISGVLKHHYEDVLRPRALDLLQKAPALGVTEATIDTFMKNQRNPNPLRDQAWEGIIRGEAVVGTGDEAAKNTQTLNKFRTATQYSYLIPNYNAIDKIQVLCGAILSEFFNQYKIARPAVTPAPVPPHNIVIHEAILTRDWLSMTDGDQVTIKIKRPQLAQVVTNEWRDIVERAAGRARELEEGIVGLNTNHNIKGEVVPPPTPEAGTTPEDPAKKGVIEERAKLRARRESTPRLFIRYSIAGRTFLRVFGEVPTVRLTSRLVEVDVPPLITPVNKIEFTRNLKIKWESDEAEAAGAQAAEGAE